MRFLSIAAGIAAVAACAADPSRPLTPDDPTYQSGWRPPPSPTAGLKRFRPVEAGNWLELNKPRQGEPMPGMSGMHDHSGMKGMPGMGAGR